MQVPAGRSSHAVALVETGGFGSVMRNCGSLKCSCVPLNGVGDCRRRGRRAVATAWGTGETAFFGWRLRGRQRASSRAARKLPRRNVATSPAHARSLPGCQSTSKRSARPTSPSCTRWAGRRSGSTRARWARPTRCISTWRRRARRATRIVVAPPMFAVVYSAPAVGPPIFDPEIELNFAMMVHGGQEFVWGPPVRRRR